MAAGILLCEDDLISLKVIGRVFANNDFEITLAGHGSEAVQQIDKGNFDFVITEFLIPQ